MDKINFLAQNNSVYNNEQKKPDKKLGFLGNSATDSVDLTENSAPKEEKKENFLYAFLRRQGVKDPQKTTKSLLFVVATVVGLALFGNKTASKMIDVAQDVEEKFLLKEGSLYLKAANALKGFAGKIGKFLKTNKVTGGFVSDVSNAFKDGLMKPVWNFARGTGRGPKNVFEITPVETIKNALINNKNRTLLEKYKDNKSISLSVIKEISNSLAGGKTTNDDIIKILAEKLNDVDEKTITNLVSDVAQNRQSSIESLGNLVGKADAPAFYERLFSDKEENATIVADLVSKIQKNNSNAASKKGLKKFFDELMTNPKYAEFQDVDMIADNMRFMNSWWPVNIVNSALEKLGLGKTKFAKHVYKYTKGNLGDALMKCLTAEGKMTDTKLAGALIASPILILTESITNFVNDKSGLGFFLCKNMVDSYDNIQDAPKEKKLATAADDFLGSAATWTLTTPLAVGATYGLATLSKFYPKQQKA